MWGGAFNRRGRDWPARHTSAQIVVSMDNHLKGLWVSGIECLCLVFKIQGL